MKSICKNIFSLGMMLVSAGVCGSVRAAESGSTSSAADVKYTGVYKERQIIPNSMAIYCKVNAEDVLKDVTKLHDCVNQIIRKMNDSDAAKKAAGVEEYNNIKYDELKNMAAQAVAKSGTIANYEELQNKYAEAMATAKTEHEDNVSVANTLSVLTDVVNSMRDLYAERLRNIAIEGMSAVDPAVIVELNDGKSSESSASSTNTSSDSGKTKKVVGEAFSSTTTYTTENPYVSEGVWQSGNKCEYEICTGKGKNSSELECTKETDTCTDGLYDTSETGKKISCIGGNCHEIQLVEDYNEQTQTSATSASQYTYAGSGKCKGSDNKEISCPDGTYEYKGQKIMCTNGSCGVAIDEVTVTGTKK